MAQFALITRVAKFATVIRNRADFFSSYGFNAPEMDWTRLPQSFIDTRKFEDQNQEIEYIGLKLDPNGKPYTDQATGVCELKKFTLYPEVAGSVNLLPEPMLADAAMTTSQRAMAKRSVPLPLELLPGEKVVLSRDISSVPVVDDGKPLPGSLGGGGYTEADRSIAKDTRALSLTISSRLARIEELLASFQNPAPK